MSTIVKKPITARECAQRTGGLYSTRFFQSLAATGIPWARQPQGEGGRILFDPDGFEKWWQGEEVTRKPKEKTWHPPTSATVLSGAKSRGAKSSVDPSRLAIKQLLTSGSKPG
jgi:hypothetical protein